MVPSIQYQVLHLIKLFICKTSLKIQKKRTNNDLQNTTQKTKDRATQTPLKSGVNSGTAEENAVPDPLVASIMLLL